MTYKVNLIVEVKQLMNRVIRKSLSLTFTLNKIIIILITNIHYPKKIEF